MANPEIIRQLEAHLFTPALQQAVSLAKKNGHDKDDTLFAIANAYNNMLIPFLGDKKNAEDFLQRQLESFRDLSLPEDQ